MGVAICYDKRPRQVFLLLIHAYSPPPFFTRGSIAAARTHCAPRRNVGGSEYSFRPYDFCFFFFPFLFTLRYIPADSRNKMIRLPPLNLRCLWAAYNRRVICWYESVATPLHGPPFRGDRLHETEMGLAFG